jgi:ubiquinone/menaquinone biosynthesis C-methylase UbiE
LKNQKQDISKIQGREHYAHSYLNKGRVFSYAHQIDSALAFEPLTVLEVGIGTGIVSDALRKVDISVITVDCQEELKPDIIASVTKLPLQDNSVDVSLCCQVLEHLPFDQFETSIMELARVAMKGIVLSLPDITPHYEIRLRLPKFGLYQWTGTRRYRISKKEREKYWRKDGHYWAIGYIETPLKRVVRVITENGLKISRTWRVSENPYHRFFIIEKGK